MSSKNLTILIALAALGTGCPGSTDPVCSSDSDGDGFCDGPDACPDDPDNDADRDGLCADVDPCPADRENDADGDGLCESVDGCPSDPDNDQDADGLCADEDPCPEDPGNDEDLDGICFADDPCPTDPGNDPDLDGLCAAVDNCPDTANPGQVDEDADGVGNACDACLDDPINDPDGDLICASEDLCPLANDPLQNDADLDGIGDACDACLLDPLNDDDADGVCGDVDNCQGLANPTQADGDLDGVGDDCDNCPTDANATQTDIDLDTAGDACDPCPADALDDADGDGFCANVDNCPVDPNASQVDQDGDGAGDDCDICPTSELDDGDGDGVCTVVDNCPSTPNPLQIDGDSDGLGDDCDPCPGNPVCGEACLDGVDNDYDGLIDCDDDDCWTEPSCPYMGTITTPDVFVDASMVEGMAFGDVTGDGFTDVIVGTIEDPCVWPCDTLIVVEKDPPAAGPLLNADYQFNESGAYGVDRIEVGDATGDGLADVVAKFDSGTWILPGPINSGGVTIGSAAILIGPAATVNNNIGWDISMADVNGDGLDDLMLGDPSWDSQDGRAYLLFGPVTSGGDVDVIADVIYERGQYGTSYIGEDVELGADTDGDGTNEVIIRRQFEIDVFDAAATSGTIGIDTFDRKITGTFGDRWEGQTIDFADVNGDGYDDLALGNPQWGGGYMSSAAILTGPLPTTIQYDQGYGFIEGTQLYSNFGAEVFLVDMDQDGEQDLVVSDFDNYLDPAVRLYYGPLAGVQLKTDWDATFIGSSPYARLGVADDLDRDGYPEIVISNEILGLDIFARP